MTAANFNKALLIEQNSIKRKIRVIYPSFPTHDVSTAELTHFKSVWEAENDELVYEGSVPILSFLVRHWNENPDAVENFWVVTPNWKNVFTANQFPIQGAGEALVQALLSTFAEELSDIFRSDIPSRDELERVFQGIEVSMGYAGLLSPAVSEVAITCVFRRYRYTPDALMNAEKWWREVYLPRRRQQQQQGQKEEQKQGVPF